jgi:glycopeptide antibiotics resistance protein
MEIAPYKTSQELSSDTWVSEEMMYSLVMAALILFPWVATAYIAWGSARAHWHGPTLGARREHHQ